VYERDKKTVVVKNAETGAVVGTYTVKKDVLEHHAGVPGFTPDGMEFVFVERLDRHTFNVHAVSTRTGSGRILARAMGIQGPKGDLDPHHLFPGPCRSTLLTQLIRDDGGTPPQSIYALDLAGGRSSPVNWVAEHQPQIHFPGQGIRFSPEGRRMMFWDQGRVTLADWPSGAHEVFYAADGQYRLKHSPVFTPDGKRLVVLDVWDRQWQIMYFRGSGPPRGPDKLELTDLTTHAKLAEVEEKEFPDAHGIGAGVAVSGNGKVLVLWGADRVRILDFERAFGVAPLPVASAAAKGNSGQ